LFFRTFVKSLMFSLDDVWKNPRNTIHILHFSLAHKCRDGPRILGENFCTDADASNKKFKGKSKSSIQHTMGHFRHLLAYLVAP